MAKIKEYYQVGNRSEMTQESLLVLMEDMYKDLALAINNNDSSYAISDYFAVRTKVELSNVTGDGTTYNILFGTTDTDSASQYTATTGQYKVPYDCQLFVCCSLLIGGISSSHTTGKYLFAKNGGEIGAAFRGNLAAISDAGNNYAGSLNCFISVKKDDLINVVIKVDSGSKTIDIQPGGGLTLSNFQGFCLKT